MTVLATAAENIGRLAGKQRKRQDAALLLRYAMIQGNGAMGLAAVAPSQQVTSRSTAQEVGLHSPHGRGRRKSVVMSEERHSYRAKRIAQ
jgi:hypothetical protein